MANEKFKKQKHFFGGTSAELKAPTGSIIESVGYEEHHGWFVEFWGDINGPRESRCVDIYPEGGSGWSEADKNIGGVTKGGTRYHFFEKRPDLS